MDESLADSLRRVEALMTGKSQESAGSTRSFEVLIGAVEDRSAPLEARRAAFAELAARFSIEPDFSRLVIQLFDDPQLIHDAIVAAPPFDAKVIARLRGFLDDPRDTIRESAALALARKKDHEILPRMLAWARRGNPAERAVGLAAVAFLLIPEQHLAVVESICEQGPRDDDDELVLIAALRLAESRMAFWRKNAKQQPDDEE